MRSQAQIAVEEDRGVPPAHRPVLHLAPRCDAPGGDTPSRTFQADPDRPAPEGTTARSPVDPAALLRAMAGQLPGAFALTVRGNTMRDSLLADGDVVYIDRTAKVLDGELAAVRLSGRPVSLRRVYRDGAKVRLQSENRRIPSLVVHRSAVKIHGRVVMIARRRGLAST